MNILAGVDPAGVDPVLWVYLGAIATMHRQITDAELIVTSLRRPPGDRPSRHSPPPGEPCTAADIRRWALDHENVAAGFARDLQRRFGAELGVVLEPEWLTADEVAARGGVAAIGPHLHVELKGAAPCRLV